MQIRKSTEQDFKRMMEIYAYARGFMSAHGNPRQWGPITIPVISMPISGGSCILANNLPAAIPASRISARLSNMFSPLRRTRATKAA